MLTLDPLLKNITNGFFSLIVCPDVSNYFLMFGTWFLFLWTCLVSSLDL